MVRSVILIAVQFPTRSDAAVERSLDELALLAQGLGYHVKSRLVQKRERAAPTYLGEGKLREAAAITGGPGSVARGPDAHRQNESQDENASGIVVIADDELSPGQLRSLELALSAEVLDRTAVILRVFEARARTREAKLEVELARLQYELPRVRDDHSLGDREGGGGRASRGHTNVELAKQRARERMAAVRRELEQLRRNAEGQRRARAEVFSVALVGYTNAGKSSLMRLLTGSDVLVEDKLFATLGTTVRQLAPPAVPPVLIADTVGFINRLPHELVASFRSTLEEAREAWLLLLVVDASDPDWRAQLEVTRGALRDIGAAETPAWIVLNKIDRVSEAERAALAAELPEAIPLCALAAADGAALRERIVGSFAEGLVEERLTIPYARHGILAEARERLQIVAEEFSDEITVTVRATPEALGRLKARLAGKKG